MPPRSNAFQQLVFHIQQALADSGAVTESEMLPDTVTGRLREVDVVVRGTVGQHRLTIGLECRDHSRVQDVTWVEQMKSKHERLPTDSLVLVSSSGFSEEARRVATLYNITLYDIGRGDSHAAEAIVGGLDSVWLKRLDVRPDGVVAWLMSDVQGEVIEASRQRSPPS